MLNKKYWLIIVFFISLLLVTRLTSADIVDVCKTLSSPGQYELNQPLSSATTCLTITSSNLVLDCKGNTIFYNTGGGATNYGINVIYLLVPLTNITLANCIIQDTTVAGTPSAGIQFTRVSDSYIVNNSIQTNGTTLNHGILFTTGCKRNRIENNTINTLGSGVTNVGIYFTTESSNNNITGNTISGVGTTTSYAIYMLVDSNDNLVQNNSLSTISTVGSGNADSHVVVISSSNRNNITGNYIYSQGYQRSYTVYLTTNANGNVIEYNNIVTSITAATAYGVYILYSPNNIVQGNTITPNGTGTLHGVYATNAPYATIQDNVVNINNTAASTLSGVTISSSSPYTTIQNNTLLISGNGTINGVSIVSSGSSVIQENNISIVGVGSTINGIISTDSPDSFIEKNNISINAAGTLNGISATTSYLLDIQNNNILVNGTTALNGILGTTSRSISIESNAINVSGTGATNYGVYLLSSSSGSVKNNNISASASTPAYGIYLYRNSMSALIEGNRVSSYGTGNANPGIYLSTGSNQNIVRSNVINTTGLGTTNYGIYIVTCDKNLLELNNISTRGTTANHGVYIVTQAENNTVKDNIINTYGTSGSYGVYVNSANKNKIIGNNIRTNSSVQTPATSTTNYGISVGASSYFSEVYNNTVYTGGGANNYGVYILTNSRWGAFSGNNIYSNGTGATNYGLFISESHYNTFENNLISSSGSATDHGVYLYSSSRGNILRNNTISASGSTDSHAFAFLNVSAGGYPESNIIQNNNILSASGNDLNFGIASINGTWLIDQQAGKYSFTGTAGSLIIENSSAGKISFAAGLLSGTTQTDFSNRIYVKDNLAYFNESVSGLNKSAEITLYNISTTSTELQIYRNGDLCNGLCNNLTSMQAGSVTFNVTRGGNYSIYPISSLPVITLNEPGATYATSQQDLNFNFTAKDDSIGNLNCSIYINSILNKTNSSTENNTLTNFLVEGIAEGNYSWYIACFDSAGNGNVSETRNFTLTIAQPQVVFNYPGNSQYINNVNSVLLNYTVFDNDSRIMTVWLYGDDSLLNTSENIANGTQLVYNWSGLSLGEHNWSIKTGNGIKNSTQEYNYFNLINLTINCEAGGDYLENPTVLVQGAISDNSGLVLLSLQIVNISIYRNSTGDLIISSNTTTESNGLFTSIFTGLGVDNYTAYATVSYSGITVNNSDSFKISLGYESGYAAGLIAGNESGYILGLNEGNITGFNLGNTTGFIFGNITGFELGNITGFNFGNITGFILGNESGYILGNATGFTLGNITGFILGNESGYILGNATGFDLGNATGFTLGNLSGFILGNLSGFYFGNQTGYESGYAAGYNAGPASFVLDKIASLYELTNNTITYNITLRLTNKGRSNVTNVTISDIEYPGLSLDLGNISQGESVSRSYLLNFNRSSKIYYNLTSIALVEGIDLSSNSTIFANSSPINLTIPSTESGQQLTLIKNAYFNSENTTRVNYTLTIEVVNSGGEDLEDITLLDSDLSINTLIDLNRSQKYNYSNFTIIEKEASNLEYLFVKSTATVNTVTYSSNQIRIIIPGYGGPADAIVYAPPSVQISTSFNTIIKVVNQNPDIGQDFVVDYWITNEPETINYSSGQQTLYIGYSNEINLTATLTSPSNTGNYKFKALVTWVGGTATSYDSFEVFGGTTNETIVPSGGKMSTETKEETTEEIVCNRPYIRYGKECCLDENNNSLCDSDEPSKSLENKTEFSQKIEESPKKGLKCLPIILLAVMLVLIILFILKKITRKNSKDITKLRNIIGKEVYAENGERIGKIKEVYIEENKVYGWLIEPSKKLTKKTKKKKILILNKNVKSIGEIMVVEEKVAEHLDNFTSSEII